jgi:hypothetical protein
MFEFLFFTQQINKNEIDRARKIHGGNKKKISTSFYWNSSSGEVVWGHRALTRE